MTKRKQLSDDERIVNVTVSMTVAQRKLWLLAATLYGETMSQYGQLTVNRSCEVDVVSQGISLAKLPWYKKTTGKTRKERLRQ